MTPHSINADAAAAGSGGCIYLAGPMNGQPDSVVFDWRREATALLDGFTILDPSRNDWRGKELGNHAAIVNNDLRDIAQADIVLARADIPAWGTAMEIKHAFDAGKLVVLWTQLTSPSPWLRVHSHCVVPHLIEAVEFIRGNVR